MNPAGNPASNPARNPATAQLSASDPSASAWVSASAGTGKTRVLTDRVLRLMLAGAAPDRILCLTFTKAAAAEMANRLNQRLGGWAMMADDELEADLLNLAGRAADDEGKTVARGLFARVLDVPGGLKIQTIHAFCQSLLGRFPLEAGLAPHFQIMDERTAAELLQEARDAMLVEAQGDAALAEALRNVTARAGEQVFAEVMASLSGERRRLARLFAASGGLAGAVAATRRRLGLADGEDSERIVSAACADHAFDMLSVVKAAQALDRGGKTDKARAAVMADWLARPGKRAEFFDDYAGTYLTKEGGVRARLATKAVVEAMPAVEDILSLEAGRLLAVRERLMAASVFEATAALLAIGRALLAAYEALKRRRARLDYDDLILLAQNLLARSDQAAWVLYKLDGGLDHILVDEAQDTNPDQWAVISALADEFFAGEGARQADRTVFAVGDAKQSIYGFQRADPATFAGSRERFGGHVLAAGKTWRPVELAVSFRSTPAVLDLVDKVFAAAPARDGLIFDQGDTGGPGEVRHFSHRPGQAGRVELWPPTMPPEAEAEDWSPPVDQRAELSASTRLAQDVAARIGGWISSGEELPSRGRAVRPGDVMILVQRRTDFIADVISALKAQGVPVAGTDRMVLSDQLVVMDLISAARFALLPDDDLSLAEVLKSPLCNLDDDDLFELAHGREDTLWRSLQRRAGQQPDDHPWAQACGTLQSLLAGVDFAPPYEFFARLLGAGGARRRLRARLGPEIDDPIDEFLALALQFEKSHAPALQGFLHWIEAGETEVKRDPELRRDEVRVMTVHGAKGLQAPIVILPDTVRVPRMDERLLWPAPDKAQAAQLMLWPGAAGQLEQTARGAREAARLRRDQEYRRLLYVAMTRAEDRLYVGGWETSRGRSDHCWYDLIARAMAEISTTVETPYGLVQRFDSAQDEAPDRLSPASQAITVAPVCPDWVRQNPQPEPTPPTPLAPSRPDGEEPPVRSPLDGDDGGRFQRGRLIHRLLQTLPELAPEAREAAGLRFLAHPAHGLDDGEQRAIVGETQAVLEQAEFAPLFAPGSRAEVAIAGVLGEHVISGQVDRLVVTEGRVMIVDYKTNRPPPTSAAGVPPLYVAQMAAYRAALAQIYPDHEIVCALLWTDSGHLMALADEALDAHMTLSD